MERITGRDSTRYRRNTIMTMKNRIYVRAQIFVHESQNGEYCIPYKTLIGYGIGNRVIVDGAGEHLYCGQVFESMETAANEAKRNALKTMKKKFPHVEEQRIIWDVVPERALGLDYGSPRRVFLEEFATT
ncbi:MAG TPA: hypothetical protein VLA60_15805 [Nitrospirales bacterium]|nr:hypothetical protein [Nitrospirales bacterium]